MTPAQEDYEFWMCMAIMVEAAETMPDLDKESSCNGLCSLVKKTRLMHLISSTQERLLTEQISQVRPKWYLASWSIRWDYYWKKGAWRPRVRAMKKLAKLALER